MTYHDAGTIELQRAQARACFEGLRDRICEAIEVLEREAPAELFPRAPASFVYKPWQRISGGGGGTGGFLKDGRLFEKAAVHTSTASGRLTPEIAKTVPGGDDQFDYVSTSISLIIHPRSPRVPTVHMNTRFLATSRGWFGGGADLTPMLPEQRSQGAEDALEFHRAMRGACDAHHPQYYSKFKAWADEYFFLPHRNEARGVGGITFMSRSCSEPSRMRCVPRALRGWRRVIPSDTRSRRIFSSPAMTSERSRNSSGIGMWRRRWCIRTC